MKKLTIEEKAQRYDEAKFDAASEEWDRVYRKGLDAGVNKGRAEALREQKPALSEEDEEIVEALNNYVKNLDIFFSEIKIGNKDMLSKEFREKVQSWLKSLKDRVQPKQQWSEGDENVTDIILSQLRSDNFSGVLSKSLLKEAESWFKSLKNRVQPKQEWSEEDEQYIIDTLNLLSFGCSSHSVSEVKDFLKSLKYRYTWKPSNEQMLAISTAINVIGKGTLNGKSLMELHEQLKKLRENKL